MITGTGPALSPAALGHPVLAFVHIEVTQRHLDDVGDALAAVPEIVEAFSITGGGDLLTPVVARDDAHLEDVIQKLISLPGVVRTRTEVALHEPSRTDCCTWWSRSGAQPADDLGHPGAVSGLSRADGDKVASTAWAASYAR